MTKFIKYTFTFKGQQTLKCFLLVSCFDSSKTANLIFNQFRTILKSVLKCFRDIFGMLFNLFFVNQKLKWEIICRILLYFILYQTSFIWQKITIAELFSLQCIISGFYVYWICPLVYLKRSSFDNCNFCLSRKTFLCWIFHENALFF